MAEKKTVYKIAPNIALTSKGAVFIGGQVVEEKDFASKEVFDDLVKKGKIISAEDTAKAKAEAEAKAKAEAEAKAKAEAEAKAKAQNGGK